MVPYTSYRYSINVSCNFGAYLVALTVDGTQPLVTTLEQTCRTMLKSAYQFSLQSDSVFTRCHGGHIGVPKQ